MKGYISIVSYDEYDWTFENLVTITDAVCNDYDSNYINIVIGRFSCKAEVFTNKSEAMKQGKMLNRKSYSNFKVSVHPITNELMRF